MNKEKKSKNKKILIISSILIILLVGILYILNPFKIKEKVYENNTFNKFENKEEFLSLLNKNNFYSNGVMEDGIFSGDKMLETATKSSDYSDTNIQVAGVDEHDNVKTDGEYIYTVSNNNVVILNALPVEEADIYKIIDYPIENIDGKNIEFSPQSFYVDDDHLIVIGRKTIQYDNEDIMYKKIMPYYDNYYSEEYIIYVYDKNYDFKELKKYLFEGDLVSSRKIEDNLYIIMNKGYYYNINDEEVTDEDILPYYSIDDKKTYLDYTNIYHYDNTFFDSTNIIYGINLNDLDNLSYVANTGYTSNIYVSNDNIYLVENEYKYLNPIIDMFIDFESSNNSIITKYSIDNGNITYSNSKTIPGTVINQFSMDEHNNTFRIATTERITKENNKEDGTFTWKNEINNRLFILDNNLEEISKLEKLGKEGESLMSCRFEEEKIYLVTFEKTDPLYVIDVSDVENPIIKSELQITGYSTYQHPYDDNHIIGIGFEADENGRTIGMKISVFDVSDPENVIEKFKEVMYYEDFGYIHSDVTYDHKDLLFDKDKQVLGFPISISNYNEGLYNYTSGYMVYNINLEDGISKNGFVIHKNLEEEDYYLNNSDIKKAIYINDNLYTISNNYLIISKLNDVEDYIKEININQ